MPDEVVFQLDNVNYYYSDGEKALTDITMQVTRGEKIVLLGTNGSGKSTLLKVLDGLLFPQQGTIYAFGERMEENSFARERFNFAFRQKVGFVFQNSEAQLFNPTVREEISFGPVHMGLDKQEIERRVDDIADMLGLMHILSRPPFKLSGGEKKKVAIASVLAVNPEVILLDEPTDGLDPRTKTWLINLIKQLNSAGKTLITATHDLDIVEDIAQRVMVFSEDHRLIASASPDQILGDKELLLRVNLVDEKYHRHIHGGDHRHYHSHD